MKRVGYCQIDPPMRLCVCSYWKARASPLCQRMPPYALNMFATGAPVIAALNNGVCVMMYSAW